MRDWFKAALLAIVLCAPVSAGSYEFKPGDSKESMAYSTMAGGSAARWMFRVDADGTVDIYWKAVEGAAGDSSDKSTQAIARALLAVRDGTYRWRD